VHALLTWLLLASPTQSLQKSGPVEVGAPVPWFSGWTLDNQVLNRTRLLQDPHARGFALVLFARWCKPCERGLRLLAEQKQRLKSEGVRVVLIGYREDAAALIPWLRERRLDDADLLIDRFGVASVALGAAHKSAKGEKATLPRTVVLDRRGDVRAVFGKEGADYVDRIIAATGTPPKPSVQR